MSDDGAAFAFDFGVHEHATHGGQLLTVLTAHDACLAEQGVDHSVIGGQSARM